MKGNHSLRGKGGEKGEDCSQKALCVVDLAIGLCHPFLLPNVRCHLVFLKIIAVQQFLRC